MCSHVTANRVSRHYSKRRRAAKNAKRSLGVYYHPTDPSPCCISLSHNKTHTYSVRRFITRVSNLHLRVLTDFRNSPLQKATSTIRCPPGSGLDTTVCLLPTLLAWSFSRVTFVYCTGLISLQCALCVLYWPDYPTVCRLPTVLAWLDSRVPFAYCAGLISPQCAVCVLYCSD